MKIKLDENLGSRGVDLLRAAGHDVATVRDQRLTSASDATLIGVCQRELRCLVTLDTEFANPFRFRPSEYSGIAVLRAVHAGRRPVDVTHTAIPSVPRRTSESARAHLHAPKEVLA